MAKKFALGPVFVAEWLVVSRRWQWYVARSVLVAVLLGALTLVWLARAAGKPELSIRAQAQVGRLFTGAITATQLAIVLLAAPAATAGAICLDRARGTLAHMLVTDLSSSEIVVGKLAARTLPVLCMLLCILPVPAMGALLGGIDLWTVLGAMLVTLGVAVFGCATALALSTWGTKTHEVLLTTYAAGSLWVLALPMWWGFRLVTGWGTARPSWLEKTNPLWLVIAPYVFPGSVVPEDQLSFFVVSLLASAVLTAIAVAQLRAVAAREGPRPRLRRLLTRRVRISDRLLSLLPGPSLDVNPVLWREWHRRRPSYWARAVWLLYAAMTTGLSVVLIASTLGGGGIPRPAASIGNGFQAGIGLLLLSVSAATAFAEERVRGSLDILLTTPLTTRSIVWGKWWGTFRTVPVLAIAPGAVSLALARESGRWEGVFMIVGLFIAYGAAVTSLGIALAIWVRRLDLAVALSVSVLGGVTIGWLFAVLLTMQGPWIPGLAAGSPIIGITIPTAVMSGLSTGEWRILVVSWGLWTVLYTFIAAGLGWASLLTFDHCMGRIPDAPRPDPDANGNGKRPSIGHVDVLASGSLPRPVRST
jgi:ABC-type transport system involved in multi-copper enzyme maturation permease subunit